MSNESCAGAVLYTGKLGDAVVMFGMAVMAVEYVEDEELSALRLRTCSLD